MAPMVCLTETGTTPTIGEPNQTQFVQVEREREREREREETGHRHGNWEQQNTSNGGSLTIDELDGLSSLVDVASQKPTVLEGGIPNGLQKNKTIEGTYLDYWMWLCRPNPHDTEDKPIPKIKQ